MDSVNKETITLGRTLVWSGVGFLIGGVCSYLTGISLQIVLITSGILLVVFTLYILFAFNVWGVKASEATDGVHKRSPAQRRLSLAFWAVAFGGAVLFTCFWLFGFIYSLAHSQRHFLGALLFASGGIWMAKEALRMLREEKTSL